MVQFAFQKEMNNEPQNNEIEKLNEELEHYYQKRKLFLFLGFMLIVLAIAVTIPLAIAGLTSLVTIPALLISSGIVLFILRGALFNTRIRNRKERIKYLQEHPEQQDL